MFFCLLKDKTEKTFNSCEPTGAAAADSAERQSLAGGIQGIQGVASPTLYVTRCYIMIFFSEKQKRSYIRDYIFIWSRKPKKRKQKKRKSR